ncbi:hypothetical protein ABTA42_19905, partial [Acinetobacter baumannii]
DASLLFPALWLIPETLVNAVFARNGAAWLAFGRIAAKRGGGLFARLQTIMNIVCNVASV